MSLACSQCGTADFLVAGRSFDLAFICPDCRLVMCSACAGREKMGEIDVLCFYHCRSTDLRDASIWAERLTSYCSEPGPP